MVKVGRRMRACVCGERSFDGMFEPVCVCVVKEVLMACLNHGFRYDEGDSLHQVT